MFSCVTSILRSIVRTLEVSRIIPLSNRMFSLPPINSDELGIRNDAARIVQKVFRGHLDRWICVAWRDELSAEASVANVRPNREVFQDDHGVLNHACQNQSQVSAVSELNSVTLDESHGLAEVSPVMLKASAALLRVWRGHRERARVRVSLGFDIRRHRSALQNLKIVISERQQSDDFLGKSEAVRLQKDFLRHQHGTAQHSDAAASIQGQCTALELQANASLASQLPPALKSDSNAVHLDVGKTDASNDSCVFAGSASNAGPFAGDEDKDQHATYVEGCDPDATSAVKQTHASDAPHDTILLIQRLARRWLGRRSIKARRLILWRVRLIIQAAPAALRIQAVYRGHVGRLAHRKLWKWTHDPEAEQSDYSGIPGQFALSDVTNDQVSTDMPMSTPHREAQLTISAGGTGDNAESDVDNQVIRILRSLYKDPKSKNYVLRLMLDAPLPVPSAAGRLPVHMLWEHSDDALDIPWIQLHVVPPHMQPYVPVDMQASIQSFSSDSRLPAEDDPLLVPNPLVTLAKQLSYPYLSILNGFSNGTFVSFVQMVEGRGKIVRSSMGMSCVQALMMDLCMVRVLLSCAHTCLESFRWFRSNKSPLLCWSNMEGLPRNQSQSWIWLSTNESILKWCLCRDDASMKQRIAGGAVDFASVADLMMKRCKMCLGMSLFFLRNCSNHFPASCSWVRAWYFSLQGLWYLTNGRQLSALQQMQEGFVELVTCHMRHSGSILQSHAEVQKTTGGERSSGGSQRDASFNLRPAVKTEVRKSVLMRPHSAVNTVRPLSAIVAPSIELNSSKRPASASSSFMYLLRQHFNPPPPPHPLPPSEFL